MRLEWFEHELGQLSNALLFMLSFMVENLRCLPVLENFDKLNFEILIQTQKYLKFNVEFRP